jgi:hypothetical protein
MGRRPVVRKTAVGDYRERGVNNILGGFNKHLRGFNTHYSKERRVFRAYLAQVPPALL